MAIRNTIASYGSVAKFFHWTIAVLLLCMIVFGFFLESIPKDYQPIAYNSHKLTGLTIFVLMILRGLWALINPKPILPYNTQLWERIAERSVHYLLYAVVLTMPLVGLIGSVAAGRPPHIGSFVITLPIAEDKAFAENAFTLHGILAFTLIALITIHVCAALFHHFIRKDDILRRMLPYRRY